LATPPPAGRSDVFSAGGSGTSRSGSSINVPRCTACSCCWPDHPDDYRANVFLRLIQAMPVVRDETHVLSGSELGRRVALARRAGSDWFIAALNCKDQAYTWELEPCPSR
jgi:hypothetical protein